MIENNVTLLEIDKISTADDRRTVDEDHVKILADSIARDDLIHTITVEKDTNILCAGGHRLAAWKYNRDNKVPCNNKAYQNWNRIPARYAEGSFEHDLARIELIENIQHRKLDWKEEVEGIKKVHDLLLQSNTSWTNKGTADVLGLSESHVDRAMRLQPVLTDPAISKCNNISSAYNIVVRQDNRSKADIIENIVTGKKPAAVSLGALLGEEETPVEEPESGQVIEPETPPSPILLQSFHDFVKEYKGPRFNFLHCDFPYGLNISKSEGQGTRKDVNAYDDSPDIYWDLLNTLADSQEKLLAHSCHIMFWFSQKFRRETEDFFTRRMPAFFVQPFLMIWHRSDNSGICPDPQRYGRRNYETAFLLTSGDRKIVKAKSLCFAHPGRDADSIHRSEKPYDMLYNYLQMFVDDNTVMLDPTCGSATSLRVSTKLGAKFVLGLEIDPDIQKAATNEYLKMLTPKSAAIDLTSISA